ncbi:carbohydrate binding domain-containing protein [Agromyces sp. ZXT2-3]|uniref:carbohydrate binding domain-containing protein n=1 Tax=Agromyces sp. ZXT2-3 TaxID=3461152 RepID=UPI004055169C
MNHEFVTREGTSLMLGGERLRISGANAYWLGLDENVGGVDYPTYFRIANALDTAAELGVNVIRSHMMTSTGQDGENPLAIMPALGEYNDDAFHTIDFAIAYAGTLGIRFVLPLTDEWSYYHGGHRDFTTPLGLEPNDFYSDPEAIAAFDAYIERVVGRTNSITGVPYVEDPTIMAWELGNELENMTLGWINDRVDHLKSLAPDQLVAAGRRFDIDPDTLEAAELDIVDVHYYPPTVERIQSHAATVAAAGKVYIAGEYGSNSASDALLEPLVDDPAVGGTFFWSLFGHNDRGGFVPHDDGFTLHYPGTTDKMREQTAAIRGYSAALGLTEGEVPLGQPLITEVVPTAGINRVGWRGVAGAATYRVERSVDEKGKIWELVGEVPAEDSPLLDPTAADAVRYRVTPVKPDGERGPASDPVEVGAGRTVVVDPLESLGLVEGAEQVRLDPGTDGTRAVANGSAPSLTWSVDGLRRAEIALADGKPKHVEILSSADGETWVPAAVGTVREKGVLRLVADELAGDLVRVTWTDPDVEIDRATLVGQPERAALVDPIDDLALVDSSGGPISIDAGNPGQFGGDTGRAKRDSSEAAELVWRWDDISGFDLVAWYWPDEPVDELIIEGSADGSAWSVIEPTIAGGDGNWRRFDYTARGLEGIDLIRVSWPNTGQPWTPQVGEMRLYSPNLPLPTAPGAFTLTEPVDGATGVTSTPNLRWNGAADAAFYRVAVAADAAFTDILMESAPVVGTAYRPDIELEPSTTYFWRVEAVNGFGATEGTPAPAEFTTATLPTDALVLDDFESYADDAALAAEYVPNGGGGPVVATLIEGASAGSAAASFSYDLDGPGYAGVIRSLGGTQSWWGYDGIEFEMSGTPGDTLSVQFVANGSYWEASVPIESQGWQHVAIPFADFAPPSWAGEGELDLTQVSEHSFYLGGGGTGTLLVDNLMTTLP